MIAAENEVTRSLLLNEERRGKTTLNHQWFVFSPVL